MTISNNWTREETIVAFNVYCKVPFKSSEETVDIDLENLPQGKERESLIKVRVNQSFFRSTILLLKIKNVV
ncbi:MAG: hypothetical protein WA749_07460 [Gelidibacter sp.]